MMDLNGFKSVNDTCGHAAGDDLLRRFGAEVQSLVRATDLVGRWGGDEFVLVIDSSMAETAGLMDRIREWVFGEFEIGNGAETFRVTASAATGVAEWDGKESALELFNRADRLMYQDKKTTPIANREGGLQESHPVGLANNIAAAPARVPSRP
jgi:diguanylate cyclase (GGDEF)-like protein